MKFVNVHKIQVFVCLHCRVSGFQIRPGHGKNVKGKQHQALDLLFHRFTFYGEFDDAILVGWHEAENRFV